MQHQIKEEKNRSKVIILQQKTPIKLGSSIVGWNSKFLIFLSTTGSF